MSFETTNTASFGTEVIDISAMDSFILGDTSTTTPVKVDEIKPEVTTEVKVDIQQLEKELFGDAKPAEQANTVIETPVVTEDVIETQAPNNQDAIFAELGKGLVELNKLSPLEEGVEWNQDTFLQALDSQIENGAQELLSSYIENIPEGEQLFKALFIDKVNPSSYLKLQNEILDYAKVDLGTEVNQEKILTKYLELQGNDGEQINEFIEFYKDKGTLATAATKAQEKLIERTAAESAAMIAKQEAENQRVEAQKSQFLADLRKTTAKAVTEKELDGLPINDKQAKEIIDFTTTPKFKRKDNGQELTEFDVAFMELKKDPAKYLKLAMLVKNGLNLEAAVKKEVTKRANTIFNFNKTGNTPTTTNAKSSTDLFATMFKKQ